MVGSTGGVTSSNGLGINYVDQWGENVGADASMMTRNYVDALIGRF